MTVEYYWRLMRRFLFKIYSEQLFLPPVQICTTSYIYMNTVFPLISAPRAY